MPDPLTPAFLLVLAMFGSLDTWLTMRIVSARARAWHRRRCTRRWVRHLPARPVAPDLAGRAGTSVTSAGTTVQRVAVSAVPTSTRWRVTL